MLDSLRLYLRYTGISIRGQMQYRASFLMNAFGQMLLTGLEFAGIWVLFDRFGSIRGWKLEEIALLYGMANIAFSLAEGIPRGFDILPRLVKAGDFDRILLRPRSTVLQLMGQEIVLMRGGRSIQGLIVFLWAAANLHVTWTLGKAVLALAGVIGGACLFTGLIVLQATFSFWTIESLEIWNCVTHGGVEAAQFPLTIYSRWFQRFFTFVVPLACLNYLPGIVILGRGEASAVPAAFLWLSPLVGVIFLAVCLQAWKVGIRHYTSTGS